MTFRALFIDLSPMTFRNGSLIVSTVFTLQSHVNITHYEPTLMSNLFSIFLDAGFVFDNSSISTSIILLCRFSVAV